MELGIGRVMGIGRWGVVLGVVVISMSLLVNRPVGAWVGLGLALLSLVINTVGKFAYYARLGIPASQRAQVMGAWGLLAATIGGLIADYVYGQLTPGYEGYFWALVIGTAGFGAVYWGLRRKYVPGTGAVDA